MAQVTYSFEGGTSGNTVAAGAGAGTGDTNFDAVTNAGATDTYDNAHAAHGGLANKIATTTSATSFNAWTTSIGTQTTVWVRAYLFFTAAPSVQHRVINFVGAAASRGNVLATTAGTLIFTNAAGGTVLTSAAFPTGAWFRLEAKFTGSATVGQWEYKIWNSPDSSGTPDDTQTSAANLNTGGTCDTYRFGIGTAVASAGPFWLDDIGVSTTAYLGPSATAAAAANHQQRGVQPSRPRSRALLGGRGLCAAGILATGIGPPAVPAPHQPPAISHPAPHRAQWRAGRGIPPAARPQPFRPVTVWLRTQHRAVWDGIAGPAVAAVQGTGTPQPFRPATIYRRAPHRVFWDGIAGRAGTVTPGTGTPQPFRPVTVYRRAPHRAQWQHVQGTVPAAKRQPFRPVTVWVRTAHRAIWRAIAGSPAGPPPPFTVGQLTSATAATATLAAGDTATGTLTAGTSATGLLAASDTRTGGPS